MEGKNEKFREEDEREFIEEERREGRGREKTLRIRKCVLFKF